jgi:integration host factor subunit alpha
MTLTKADLIHSIHNRLGLPKEKSRQVFESLMEIIKSSLETGEDVLISGFGKFCVLKKKQRVGRNPKTGKDILLESRKVLSFKCSTVLREKINKVDMLSGLPILSYMKRGDLRRIGRQMRYHSYNEGEMIIKEGDRDERLFVIINGKVDVIKGLGTKTETLLDTLGSGSYFGEMALIDDLGRSASVIAKEKTKILSLVLDLRQEIKKNPDLAVELLEMLSRRVRELNKS